MKSFFTCVLTVLLFINSTILFSQPSFDQKMRVWEDSLATIAQQIFLNKSEPDRIAHNFTFVKTLVSALKENSSYDYSFSKLKMISILPSPNNNFRIFSWNVPMDDGSYLYYGSIQWKTSNGNLQLLPLLDKTFEINDVEKAILKNDHWYGAQYYEIHQLANDSYILLGWKGHTPDYSQKVIEILNLSGSNVNFGATVFSDSPNITRKIFRYTREATMILKYDKGSDKIVFDHIVPADPSLKDNYKYYGPDLSYDAYEMKSGKLLFHSNVNYLNPIRGDEDKFIDPTRAKSEKQTGIR